jgi:hypothetical protein
MELAVQQMEDLETVLLVVIGMEILVLLHQVDLVVFALIPNIGMDHLAPTLLEQEHKHVIKVTTSSYQARAVLYKCDSFHND